MSSPCPATHARAAVFAIAYGALAIYGPPVRFSGPAFAQIRAWAPLSVWGVAWLGVGIALLACRQRQHLRIAAVTGALLAFTFLGGVLSSTQQSWQVPWTPGVFWLVVLSLWVELAWRLAPRRPRRRRADG